MSLSSCRTLAPAVVLVLALLALAASPAAAAPPGRSPLSAQPTAQSFGLVRVGQGEQISSLSIQNPGPDAVLVGAATIAGDSAFRVSGDGCAGQLLASGQSCNVGVGFDPGDGIAYAATLHVPADGFTDLDVPLSGVGGLQRVTLAPSALDFGAVTVGDSAVRAFTLTSTGNLPFQSIVAIPSGGDVGAFRVERDGCSLQQLSTGATCDVAVRFTPPAPDGYAATLLLIGGNDQPAIVPLRGSGAAPVAPVVAEQPGAVPAPEPATADVAFDALAGSSVPFAHGRVDLGRAHCVGATRCTVIVRARVYALAAASARAASHQARMTSARTDVVLWSLRARGQRVRLTLPASLHGRPALLVARLRTYAAGQRTGVRTLVVPLAATSRRG
ncbi:MAG TPA: choice-of-anchor D domain-containing protein [Conexibacter sp.]|jgi:hypothetical protein|nr:choice-of-anchor D domain-containing protein [Conexibacter sp.]